MSVLQGAFDLMINLSKIDVQIKHAADAVTYNVTASQSNYFRAPTIEEGMVGEGREYVISASNLTFIPKRTDMFIISADEYYAIKVVKEMRALGSIIGYRLVLE